MITLEQMQKFCDPDSCTSFYVRPVPHNNRTVATNGHILVCVDENLGVEPYDNLPRNITKFIAPENFSDGFVPLKIELAEQLPCPDCKCSGIKPKPLRVECPDCDGDGEHHIGSHYYECAECEGEGKIEEGVSDTETEPCEKCNGKGRGVTYQRVDVRSFNVEYLRLILDLPNVEYQPDNYNSTSMMRFRFDGGVGCLMPCRV